MPARSLRALLAGASLAALLAASVPARSETTQAAAGPSPIEVLSAQPAQPGATSMQAPSPAAAFVAESPAATVTAGPAAVIAPAVQGEPAPTPAAGTLAKEETAAGTGPLAPPAAQPGSQPESAASAPQDSAAEPSQAERQDIGLRPDPATMAGNPAPRPEASASAEPKLPLPELPPAPVVVDVSASPPSPAVAEALAQAPSAGPPAPATQAAEATAPSQSTDAAASPQASEPAPAAVADIPPPDLPPVSVVIDTPVRNPIAVAVEERLASTNWTSAAIAQLGKADREALAQFYAERRGAPLFVDLAGPTPAGRAVMEQVATAEADGMDPAAYPVPAMLANSPDSAAQAELGIAAAAFAYARDARGGRIEPARLSHLITPDLSLPKPAEVLSAIQGAPDPAAVLAAYQPQHEGYKALRAKLAELRETTGAVNRADHLSLGPALRLGDTDPRVPLLRARLKLDPRPGEVYDRELADAVRDLQRQNRRRASGVFDLGTAELLDGPRPVNAPIADIIANMERWRWLPTDLGQRHIMVNLPEFTLRVFDGEKVIHQTRVIVGKPQTPTPLFSNAVQHVIVNPYWNIPPSILKKEILPRLAEDPDYAARHGYEIIQRGNRISVRQPPGERNALGFIKFIFPNQHSVYLHDTPTRNLFSADRRAFSHGCVRVDQPFRLAEVLLGDEGYDEARVRKLIGKGERMIKLSQPLPIHLTYFTLFVDERGHLQRREDLYGYDGRIRTALKLGQDGRRFAGLH